MSPSAPRQTVQAVAIWRQKVTIRHFLALREQVQYSASSPAPSQGQGREASKASSPAPSQGQGREASKASSPAPSQGQGREASNYQSCPRHVGMIDSPRAYPRTIQIRLCGVSVYVTHDSLLGRMSCRLFGQVQLTRCCTFDIGDFGRRQQCCGFFSGFFSRFYGLFPR